MLVGASFLGFDVGPNAIQFPIGGSSDCVSSGAAPQEPILRGCLGRLKISPGLHLLLFPRLIFGQQALPIVLYGKLVVIVASHLRQKFLSQKFSEISVQVSSGNIPR